MVGRLAAGVLLAVLLCAAFPSVLFGGRTLSSAAWLPGVLPTGPVGAVRPVGPAPVRDVEGASWVDEPAPYLAHQGLAAGRLPLWNDAEGFGIALLGNPNMGALAPLQLAVNLFPSAWTQDLAWLARPLLLALFTFGLARALGSRWLGAFAAAASLLLSGQTVEWIEHHPLNTDVFVPAALWAALAIPRTGRRGIAFLALAVGAGLLGVKPQSALVAGLFGIFLLLAAYADRGVEGGGLRLGGRLASWVAGVLLGVGIAAIALLPFREAYDQASGLVRAGRTTQSEWTLPLTSLGSLGGTLALEIGNLPGGGAAGPGALPPGLPYAGLAVIAGAALGLGRTRGSWVSRVLAGAVVVEVLRIHGLLPIPLGEVPLLGSINYVKYCFPLYLALALLLARGVDSIPRPAALAVVVLVAAELLWLVPRNWAERVAPYRPSAWVAEMQRLAAERPGRMSGPVDLAPPLVSAAVGLRDLRSIDVLTPRETYDFVSRLIAPSRGVTWILADPDPLLAATGPGSNLADLRWIVSRRPLDASELPAAVRAGTAARRLVRLFDDLERQETETASLGGGIHDGEGDRRFHWTCETPCRFTFELRRLPEHFVAGLASPEPTSLRVRLGVVDGQAPARRVAADRTWQDVWWHAEGRAGGPGTVVLEIDGDAPASVFVGGVGPAPAPATESRRERRELAFRASAFGRLELRWHDDVAHIYENVDAMGEAAFARRAVSIADRGGALSCVAEAPGERVACVGREDVAPSDLPRAVDGTASVVSSEPERLHVETESDRGGLLLVSRLFDPGWRARVDGREQRVLPADGALMALEIPAGRHDVVLEYAPTPFRIGLLVSCLSVLVVAALLWSGRAAPRRASDPRGTAAGSG